MMSFSCFKKLNTFIASTRFQISSICIAALYLTSLIVIQYKRLQIPEKIPTLLPVEQTIKQLATPVHVGLHVNSFPEFSINTGHFIMDAIIWFRFEKSTESIATLENFTIKNSRLQGSFITYKSAPIIKILDKEVLVSYHTLISFMSDLDFRKFPLEDHRLSIIFENKTATAQELVFVTDDDHVSVAKKILVGTWKPRAVHANAGYVATEIKTADGTTDITYPSVAFSIDFESVGAQTPISLYFPLFISFLILLMSLLLKVNSDSRLGLAASGVPALVLFRLVIESSSPSTGYATHIDASYYLVSFLALVILFFQAYITLMLHRHHDEKESGKGPWISRFETASAYLFTVLLMILVIGFTILSI